MRMYDLPVMLCFVAAFYVLDIDKAAAKTLITGVLLGLWLAKIYYRLKKEE